MGKNASARVKNKVRNKFIRALKKAESQEMQREQFFKDRKRKREKLMTQDM